MVHTHAVSVLYQSLKIHPAQFFATLTDVIPLFLSKNYSDGKVNNLLDAVSLFLSGRYPCRKTVRYLGKDERLDQTYERFLWQHTTDF